MDEDFMLGTASCDIWEVNETKQVRIMSQECVPTTSSLRRNLDASLAAMLRYQIVYSARAWGPGVAYACMLRQLKCAQQSRRLP